MTGLKATEEFVGGDISVVSAFALQTIPPLAMQGNLGGAIGPTPFVFAWRRCRYPDLFVL